MSPLMKGKHALLESLRAEGVRYVFGNPGTSEAAIMDVLEEYPDLRYVLVLQEGVAVGMAEGYGRVSGKVPFVSLHIDNGLVNAFSLLLDSFKTGTPMVVTAGNKDTRKLAEGRMDLTELARPLTKWSAEITRPEQYPAVIRRAFNEARTPPTGPVFVSFAADSYDEEAEVEIVPSRPHYVEPPPDPRAIDEAARLLAGARAPLMLVGDRVSRYRALAAAVAVAERTGARVHSHAATDLNFPESHPQFAGPFIARQAARKVLEAADVVLAVGCPVFSDFFYVPGGALGVGTRLIHVDLQPGEIGKSQPTDVGILASPRLALEQLDGALAERMSAAEVDAARGRAAGLAAEQRRARAAFAERAEAAFRTRPMGAAALVREIRRHWPDDALLVDDSISIRAALRQGMQLDRPGSIVGGTLGAIGSGMGFALGAQLARPGHPVIAVVGDGSAMMTVQALWTAVASRIPVVFVICNNASYRILKLNLDVYRDLEGRGGRRQRYHPAFDFAVPFDMAAIARAFGMPGVRIEDPEQIGPELGKALASGGPALLDVIIDGTVR